MDNNGWTLLPAELKYCAYRRTASIAIPNASITDRENQSSKSVDHTH